MKPEKWYIQFTNENREILYNYWKNHVNVPYDFKRCNIHYFWFKPGFYLLSKHSGDDSCIFANENCKHLEKLGYVKLNDEEFKSLILNNNLSIFSDILGW